LNRKPLRQAAGTLPAILAKLNAERRFTKNQKSKMSEQEYNDKMRRIDKETKERFGEMFNKIYIEFRGMSYSKAELFLEHLKRTLKKDSRVSGQGWEIPPTV